MVHLKLGRKWNLIVFCMYYIQIDIVLFLYKICIEIIQVPYVLYVKDT
jgi:hypothetical protein